MSTTPPGEPTGTHPSADAPDWSVSNALNYGFTKFVENVGQILLAALLLFVASIIAFAIEFPIRSAITDNDSNLFITDLASAIALFVYLALTGIVQAALIRGTLDITEGRRFRVGDLFSRFSFGKVVVASILVSLIISIGWALFFLPGLIAWFFLLFTPFFVVDRDMSPVDAIKASLALTRDNFGSLLIWVIVATLVYLAGFCILCIGFIVTGPLVLIGATYTYKKFTHQPVAA
jgi:uncharacterized membrane protein